MQNLRFACIWLVELKIRIDPFAQLGIDRHIMIYTFDNMVAGTAQRNKYAAILPRRHQSTHRAQTLGNSVRRQRINRTAALPLW